MHPLFQMARFWLVGGEPLGESISNHEKPFVYVPLRPPGTAPAVVDPRTAVQTLPAMVSRSWQLMPVNRNGVTLDTVLPITTMFAFPLHETVNAILDTVQDENEIKTLPRVLSTGENAPVTPEIGAGYVVPKFDARVPDHPENTHESDTEPTLMVVVVAVEAV